MTEEKFNPQNAVNKIIIGVRHQRNFSLSDVTGEIVDIVTKDKHSPFSDGFFENVLEGPTRERILQTADKKSLLRINTDDLIFEHHFSEGENVFEKKFSWVVGQCLPFFIDNILKKYKITDLFRLGIIFGHKIEAKGFANQLVLNVTNGKLNSTDSLILRFAKKLPVDTALALQKVNDYKNVNLMVNLVGKDLLQIDFDIQHYFDPPLRRYEDFDILRFFQIAKQTLFSDYHPILSSGFSDKCLEHEVIQK